MRVCRRLLKSALHIFLSTAAAVSAVRLLIPYRPSHFQDKYKTNYEVLLENFTALALR